MGTMIGRACRRLWREWLRPVLPVVVVLLGLRSAVADWNDVPTGSMKPTIVEGDRILVNKLAYDLRLPFVGWPLLRVGEPRRGDIVVFFSPNDGTRMVKRVVGLPGDVIELRANRLYVNGAPADYQPIQVAAASGTFGGYGVYEEKVAEEEHRVMISATPGDRYWYGPKVVPADHLFVMGDNRDHSFDSRWYGSVSRDRVVGRAEGVILSLDLHHRFRPRWDRFFHGLD